MPIRAPAASPAASGDPGTASPKRDRLGWKAFGPGPGGIGRGGFNSITITAIDGTSVSLKTDDGWTRTITLTDTTTITKAGATITAGDLAVGDEVRIGQDRADDGTYTVTRLAVVLPTLVGEVTAVNGSTITITQRGGTTATIHVDGDTTFRVDGAAGSLSDVKVGSIVIAEGTQRADGSLDADEGRDRLRARAGQGSRPPQRQGRGRQPGALEQPQLTPAGRSAGHAARPEGLGRAAFDSHGLLRARRFDGRTTDRPHDPSTIGAPDD